MPRPPDRRADARCPRDPLIVADGFFPTAAYDGAASDRRAVDKLAPT
jgi:hypothetical protein